MNPFRRRRPLHERLAAQAGLDSWSGEPAASGLDAASGEGGQAPSRLSGLAHALAGGGHLAAPPDLFGHPAHLGEVAVHGVARPRRWDVVASAQADLPGHELEFVALPDGTLVLADDLPDGVLDPLADAIEAGGVLPPYRAHAVRRERGFWGVGAVRITVRELPDEQGEEIERVEDGRVLRGRRIDGDLWEVEESRL